VAEGKEKVKAEIHAFVISTRNGSEQSFS